VIIFITRCIKKPPQQAKETKMERYQEVSGGIYIDNECTGLTRVQAGVFIPTDYQNSMAEEEFRRDLFVFLEKWFPESVVLSSREPF
jgi:hypothetical protein